MVTRRTSDLSGDVPSIISCSMWLACHQRVSSRYMSAQNVARSRRRFLRRGAPSMSDMVSILERRSSVGGYLLVRLPLSCRLKISSRTCFSHRSWRAGTSDSERSTDQRPERRAAQKSIWRSRARREPETSISPPSVPSVATKTMFTSLGVSGSISTSMSAMVVSSLAAACAT